MRRRRLSIIWLASVVVISGVGIAALRFATEVWAGVVFTLALFVLGIAVLGVIYRYGARRAFWSGFALFGWGYMVVCFAPWFRDEVRPYLFTTKLQEAAVAMINPPQVQTPAGAGDASANGSAYVVIDQAGQGTHGRTHSSVRNLLAELWGQGVDAHAFERICHSLWALLFGLLGALLGRALWIGRDQASPAPGPSKTEAASA
jgi:hypothetical protein